MAVLLVVKMSSTRFRIERDAPSHYLQFGLQYLAGMGYIERRADLMGQVRYELFLRAEYRLINL